MPEEYNNQRTKNFKRHFKTYLSARELKVKVVLLI